jgi:integrase
LGFRDALKENPDWEDASWEAIDAARQRHHPQIADMVDLQTLSGMRNCEICGMKVGEIDKNPKGRLSGLGYWLYTPSKHKTQRSGKIRQIPLGEEEQAILEKYLTGKKPDAPIFCNLYRFKSHAMKPRTFGQYIKEAIDAHGLEKFTAYQLRHAHATWCGEHLDEDHARARLGHASAAMTRKYNHSDIQKQIAVLEKRKAVGSPIGNFAPPTPEKTFSSRPLRIYTGE